MQFWVLHPQFWSSASYRLLLLLLFHFFVFLWYSNLNNYSFHCPNLNIKEKWIRHSRCTNYKFSLGKSILRPTGAGWNISIHLWRNQLINIILCQRLFQARNQQVVGCIMKTFLFILQSYDSPTTMPISLHSAIDLSNLSGYLQSWSSLC